jgi:hypothetical protein
MNDVVYEQVDVMKILSEAESNQTRAGRIEAEFALDNDADCDWDDDDDLDACCVV